MFRKKMFFAKCIAGALAMILCFGNANAQTNSNFETLTIPVDSCWNGSDFSGGFQSGAGFFVNHFADWGGGYTSWDGFAYSNMKDSTSIGYLNQYSAIAGSGFNGSQNYAVGYCYPTTKIRISQATHPKTVQGVYVTNNTYAAISMRDGDAYSKKFGGATGNDPDWFKLNIWGYKNGLPTDTVNFYLADFRPANNDSDYIVKNWRWVDLTSMGNVDSVEFALSSSDNGQYGMNTPAFFCVDNFLIDLLPENELGSDSLFIGASEAQSYNLDTFFVDLDTPDSSLTYEIAYNSEPVIFNATITENILDVFVLGFTKDANLIYNGTLVIKANSLYGYSEITLQVSADVSSHVTINEVSRVSIFPNPTTDFLQINAPGKAEIFITDISGKIVWSEVPNIDNQINVSHLTAGMYFISIQNQIYKFIKN